MRPAFGKVSSENLRWAKIGEWPTDCERPGVCRLFMVAAIQASPPYGLRNSRTVRGVTYPFSIVAHGKEQVFHV
jgi:hypothetical protein